MKKCKTKRKIYSSYGEITIEKGTVFIERLADCHFYEFMEHSKHKGGLQVSFLANYVERNPDLFEIIEEEKS